MVLGGTHAVIQFVAKLLGPGVSESAALYTGKLILSVVDNMAGLLEPGVLADMVRAIATRLHSVKLYSLIAVCTHV